MPRSPRAQAQRRFAIHVAEADSALDEAAHYAATGRPARAAEHARYAALLAIAAADEAARIQTIASNV